MVPMGAASSGVIIFFILSVLFGGFILYLGAKMAGIERATFGKSVLAAFVCSLVSSLFMGAGGAMPFAGSLIGIILGFVLTLFVLKSIFGVGWGRAFVVWIMQFVAQILVMIVLSLLLGGMVAITGGLG